jgi:hypothetical protein
LSGLSGSTTQSRWFPIQKSLQPFKLAVGSLLVPIKPGTHDTRNRLGWGVKKASKQAKSTKVTNKLMCEKEKKVKTLLINSLLSYPRISSFVIFVISRIAT